MVKSNSPKIYAGMLKRELMDVARRLGLEGVSRLRKDELLKMIQAALRRPKHQETAPDSPRSRGRGAKGAEATKTKKKGAKGTSEEKAKKNKTTQPSKARAKDRKSREPSAETKQKGPTPETSPLPETTALSEQSQVTAAKYGRGVPFPAEDLRHIDAALPGLPEGYGEDRIVLLPRDPEWLYAYWDIRNDTKEQARSHGGFNLVLRLFELQGDQLLPRGEHWVQEYARTWYLGVPSSGQTYVVEIGYRNSDGGWFSLLRSNVVTVPPSGPSPIVADHFATITPDELLDPTLSPAAKSGRAATIPATPPPPKGRKSSQVTEGSDSDLHEMAYRASLGERGGSIPGSIPTSIAAGPPWSASQRPAQVEEDETREGDVEGGRRFWLMAEAELVVFGATEPHATLTLGGQNIPLREDGTFSVRMAFPDGVLELPIEAIAGDGEQKRSLKMSFERATGSVETLEGRTQ